MFTNFDKAIVGVIVPLLLSYLTPELINQLGLSIGEFVTAAVVAALTGVAVYLMPNKE